MSITRRGAAGVLCMIAGACHTEPASPPPASHPVARRADRLHEEAPAGLYARRDNDDRVAVPGAALPHDAPARPARPASAMLSAEEGELAVEVSPATAGVETTARVRLIANRGYEVNEQFHYKLTLEPTPGVTLAKMVFSDAGHDAEQLDRHELAIAMKLTADQPGDYTVHGKLNFAVCKTDSQCLPKTMPVAVQLAAR